MIGLSFHVASAGVVRLVLAEGGVAHTVVEHPHERMFEMLAKGQVDMLASAWLPGSHGACLAACGDDVIKLGVLYEPHAIWGVPDYVPSAEVSSLQDLAKPHVGTAVGRLSRRRRPVLNVDVGRSPFPRRRLRTRNSGADIR